MMGSTKSSTNSVRIFNDQGISVMDFDKMDRAGDRLHMRGTLIGQFETDLYIGAGDFYRMLAVLLSPAPLVFVLLSPYYWLRNYRQGHGQESRATSVAKMLLFSVIVFFVCLVMVFVAAMVVLGIYELAV